MDVNQLKRDYGKYIVLNGGLSTQRIIPNGTLEEVLSEARDRLEVLGKDGGYIFGTSGVSSDSKIENVAGLIDFARNRYR